MKPERPNDRLAELEARLREAEEQRHELLEELRRVRDERTSTPPKRDTLSFGAPRRAPSESPGFHMERARSRKSSDVVAVAPDSVPGISRYAKPPRESRGVEDRADFDAGLLRQLDASKLDTLPYGVVCVDSKGRILEYNDTEARMVGLERERVVGRNFFTEVAPCTRIQAFLGRFEDFVATDNGFGVETFDFVFRFRHSVQSVTVYITAGKARGSYNISMLRRKIERL